MDQERKSLSVQWQPALVLQVGLWSWEVVSDTAGHLHGDRQIISTCQKRVLPRHGLVVIKLL